MTRVLLVHQPTDGGVGRHLRDVARGIAAKGYEVVVCGPERPTGLGQEFPYAPLELRRSLSPRVDAAAVAAVARIVRRVRPDIIHAHSSKAGAVTRLAKPAYPRVPVVYTPHGYAFAGYFSSTLERRAYRGIERALALLADRVVCVCEAEARLAASVGPRRRIRVVHNGVDPASSGTPDPRVAGLSGRGTLIGALTLLRPGKGLETLIDAVPRILDRHPDAHVAIFGSGPGLDAATAQVRRRGVIDSVHFPGPTSDPLSALRAVDVFVHPSWAESFPYVILEAMSLGKPVVASDVGGIPEAVTDGSTGRLARPRDSGALADAIVALLDDPGSRARMGEAGLSRVSSEFTTGLMINRLTSVYDELACSPSSRGTDSPDELEFGSPEPHQTITGLLPR